MSFAVTNKIARMSLATAAGHLVSGKMGREQYHRKRESEESYVKTLRKGKGNDKEE